MFARRSSVGFAPILGTVVNVRELRALIHDPANHPAPATGVPAALLASGVLPRKLGSPGNEFSQALYGKIHCLFSSGTEGSPPAEGGRDLVNSRDLVNIGGRT